LKRVGVHDNFLELGGHSLLATQVISRARNAFGVELPLRTVFEEPTIARFTARLTNAKGQNGHSPPVTRGCLNGKHGEVELSFGQERLWFLEQLEPGLAVYNVPIAIAFEGELNVAALEQSLNDLIARHGSLRTSFTTVQGRPKAECVRS